MHAQEIIREYAAEPAVFRHDAILISVNRSAVAASSLYEATRYAWKISPTKARKAEVVLATVQGIIKGALVADEWLEATGANFPGRQDVPGRYGFNGHDAPKEIHRRMSASASPMITGSVARPTRSSTPREMR